MKSKTKTAAALATELESAKTTLATTTAGAEQLAAGEQAAALGGIETLREFRRKRDDAILARDVAAANVEAVARALREAEDTEAEAKRLSDYDAAAAVHESVVVDIAASAEEIRGKIAELMTRARQASAAVQSVNADLPAGRPALDFIERDVRVAAGEFLETRGFATFSSPITVFNPLFWVPSVPSELPITRPAKKPEATALDKATAQAPAPEPGAWRAPTIHSLPIAEPEPVNEDRPFQPRVHALGRR